MTHAGTIDLGGSAQSKQGGSPWAAIALTAAVVATLAGVWLASSAGRVGTAKPAADRSYDQIEAQRGAITLSGGSSQAYDEKLNGILDRAHAAPFVAAAVTLTGDDTRANEKFSLFDRAHAAPYVGAAVVLTGNDTRTLNEKFLLFDRAHAAPFAGPAVTPLPSATSGTFHPGKVADDQLSATSGTFHPGKPADQVAPAKRDRVGGQ